MRQSIKLAGFGLVVLVLAAFALTSAEEGPWFDMENCAFCKNMVKDQGLLTHTSWEHHNINNGIVSVSTVTDDYLPAFRTAMEGMEKVGESMKKGEMPMMCNMCKAMGALMQKGATYQSIMTKHGSVTLMTSADPEVVKEIQAWGTRTTKELGMMEESMGEKPMMEESSEDE